jgi:hypothetical protein
MKILLISLLLVSSCGFQTIYGTGNNISSKSAAYNEELASIKVQIPRSKLNQDLKNNLEKILNPDDIEVDSKYLIKIDLETRIASTFTTDTGSSGRNKVILNAKYELIDINSEELIATGSVLAKDDYDLGENRFANYITEENISSNLTLIIAQNIRNLLIRDIVNNYKIRDIKDVKETF